MAPGLSLRQQYLINNSIIAKLEGDQAPTDREIAKRTTTRPIRDTTDLRSSANNAHLLLLTGGLSLRNISNFGNS